MIRRLVLVLMLLAAPAWAATITHGVSHSETNDLESYTTASFTPVSGDLLVACGNAPASVAAGTMTDSLGGTWDQVATLVWVTTVHKIYCYIRTALSTGAALTVTMNTTGDPATGGFIFVSRVAGMSRTGSAAFRQPAASDVDAGTSTPNPAFGSSVLTGNPTVGIVCGNANPLAVTPPTGWTEHSDIGITSPTMGCEYISRNSGFTGTTVTWNTAVTVFGALVIELDASAVAAGPAKGGMMLRGVGP